MGNKTTTNIYPREYIEIPDYWKDKDHFEERRDFIYQAADLALHLITQPIVADVFERLAKRCGYEGDVDNIFNEIGLPRIKMTAQNAVAGYTKDEYKTDTIHIDWSYYDCCYNMSMTLTEDNFNMLLFARLTMFFDLP